MPAWPTACAVLLTIPIAAVASAATHSFASSAERVAVIELYTSEGCSSCPPADRWMSSLRNDPGLWIRIVPIAFHVDYWDYLGWKDRFASVRHGERQRRLASSGGARTVYTPGMFVNGKEWRGWVRGRRPDAARPVVGVLAADVADGRAKLSFTTSGSPGDLRATVAILGMERESDVAAGENRGRKLRHDFVVLGDASEMMTAAPGGYEAVVSVPQVRESAGRLALVAWVSGADDPAPIQAVGGYL